MEATQKQMDVSVLAPVGGQKHLLDQSAFQFFGLPWFGACHPEYRDVSSERIASTSTDV